MKEVIRIDLLNVKGGKIVLARLSNELNPFSIFFQEMEEFIGVAVDQAVFVLR